YSGGMTQPGASANLPPRWQLAAALAIAVMGTAWHVWLARESLWADELHTAWCAGGSFAEVGRRAAVGNQSPLFFWIEWLLTRLLGESEFVLRLPSLIA